MSHQSITPILSPHSCAHLSYTLAKASTFTGGMRWSTTSTITGQSYLQST